MIRRIALFALASTLSACGAESEGPAPAAYVERDSAGVTIVENRFAAIPPGWSVGAEPTWRVGGFDAPEPQQLFRVRGGRVLADGRVAIANSGTGEIRIYGADGELSVAHGAKGDGPGEFQDPNLLAVRGDSLWVFDSQHRRVSILHTRDGFVRSYQIDWTGDGFPVGRGFLSDGSLVIGGGMSFNSQEGFPTGVIRPESTFGWIAPDGATETHLGDFPAAEMYAIANDGGFMATSLPFARQVTAANSDAGLWLGSGDAYELAFYGSGGTLVRIAHLDAPATTVTEAMLEADIENRLEGAQTEGQEQSIRAQVRDMPIADVLPPYQRFLVDRGQNLWVQDFLPPSMTTPTWTVFDATGHVIGRLETPDRTQLLDVDAGYLLGLTRDDFDIESLTLWTLERAGS